MNVENSNVSMAKYFSAGPSEPGVQVGPSPLEILADTLNPTLIGGRGDYDNNRPSTLEVLGLPTALLCRE